MRDECEGCSVLKPNEDCNLVNAVIESNEGILKDCPCKECLIKVMCNIPCPEYVFLAHPNIKPAVEWCYH